MKNIDTKILNLNNIFITNIRDLALTRPFISTPAATKFPSTNFMYFKIGI